MTNSKNKNRLQNDMVFQDVLNKTKLNSKILESEKYIQHGNTSVLQHSISVAIMSHKMALFFKIPVNQRELIRGALLHDYFLYDWHKQEVKHHLHGFKHPYIALQNANRDLVLSDIEKDIIKKHMFPLTPFPPRYFESMIVCIADKVCSVCETFYINSFILVEPSP